MNKIKKIILLTGISFFLALFICLIFFFSYLNKMLRISKKQAEEGFVTFSIQHESNPLDKDMQNFIDLYEELISNQGENYEYYELYLQYLENNKEDGDFFSYETGKLTDACSAINCLQISENVLEDFHILISEGRLFEQDDYLYVENGEIPILMGNDYADLYHIGDSFQWNYLFEEYTFKVIGFLEKDSGIELAERNVIMDTYIVMPSFIINENMVESNGLKIHYANKTSGVVQLKGNNVDKFYSVIEPLLAGSGVGTYSWTIRPVDLQFKEMFGFSMESAQKVILFSIFLSLLMEIWLIVRFSGFGFMQKKLIVEILYSTVIFVITSIFCFLINYMFMFFMGIILFKTMHFAMMEAGSIIVVFLCKIFYTRCITLEGKETESR